MSFFFAGFFRRLTLIILQFSKVRSVLGFFSEDFSQRTLEWESGVFWEDFSSQKCPKYWPENGEEKSSPCLRFFFSEFYFCYGTSFPDSEGFGHRTPRFVVDVFSLVTGVRFCMDLFMKIREFFLRFFRDSGAAVFGSVFSFSSSSFFFPLSSLGVGLGSPFFLLFVCWQEDRGLHRQVRRCICWPLHFFSPLLSLPWPAPLSLALFFFCFFFLSFSLSLSLSLFFCLSLSCLH